MQVFVCSTVDPVYHYLPCPPVIIGPIGVRVEVQTVLLPPRTERYSFFFFLTILTGTHNEETVVHTPNILFVLFTYCVFYCITGDHSK